MLYERSDTLDGARDRRDGRGALPAGPVPRRRVGGGADPPAAVGQRRVPVGHDLERGGVRRVDRHAARRDPRRHRGAAARAAGAPLPGRARHASRCTSSRTACRCRTPTSSRSISGSCARRPTTGGGAARRSSSGSPGRARVTDGCTSPSARRSSRSSTRTACCRRSTSCSAAPAATGACGGSASRASRSPPAPRPTTSGSAPRRRAAWIDEDDLVTLGFYEFLDGLTAGIAAHHAGHAPGVQGDGRGAVRGRPGEGGVRHRDAVARHQHAGQDGGDRGPVEVPGRATRAADPGRVHAAHRAGGPAGHRRAGPRGRRLPAAGAVRARRRARGDPDLRPRLVVPALLQHGGQPGPQLHARSRRTTC